MKLVSNFLYAFPIELPEAIDTKLEFDACNVENKESFFVYKKKSDSSDFLVLLRVQSS